MSKIKINVRFDEVNKTMYNQSFEIEEKLPEVGVFYNGSEEVTAVTPLKKDISQPTIEAGEYDAYKISTVKDEVKDDYFVAVKSTMDE